jgi:hypothetical protein
MASRGGVVMFMILPYGNQFDDLIIFIVKMREIFDEFEYLLLRTYDVPTGFD